MTREHVGQMVIVSDLPFCDVCRGERNSDVPARYDAATRTGVWGYLCEEHWKRDTWGRLGVGLGQMLITQDEYDEFQDSLWRLKHGE